MAARLNVQRQTRSQLLYDTVMGWEYESIHPHYEIAELLDLELGSNEYYHIVNHVNQQLENVGKKMVSVPKVGYQVLKPDSYTSHCTKIFEAGKNKISRAKKIMLHAPIDHMSEGARTTHQRVFERLSSFAAVVDGGCTEIRVLQNNNTIQITNERITMQTNTTPEQREG